MFSRKRDDRITSAQVEDHKRDQSHPQNNGDCIEHSADDVRGHRDTFLVSAIVLECWVVTTIRKIALILFLIPLPLFAETVFLKSGEIVEGTIRSYQADTLSIAQPNGQIRKIPKAEIVKLEFQKEAPLLKPSQEAPKTFLNALPTKELSKFQTPGQTFQTWRKAAIAGDIDGMVDCFASFRRDTVRKELKAIPKDQREQMKRTTAMTEFAPTEPLYQGDRAVLDVTWRLGLQSDDQVLQFFLEKNDWKIIQ